MKVVSLFSGCGGLDIGFVETGFSISAAFDADVRMVDTYNRNLPECARCVELSEFSSIPCGSDVILATPPCQGFSTAGGYVTADPRNELLITAARLIVSRSPKLAILENVAALGNARNRKLLHSAIQILSEAGYFAETKVLYAERLGVAQRRRRMFIIARAKNSPFNLDNLDGDVASITVKDALSMINPMTSGHNPKFLSAGSSHFRIASRVQQGQKVCNVRVGSAAIPTWDIPEVFGSVTGHERALLVAVQRLRRRDRIRAFGDADPVDRSRIANALGRCPDADIKNLVEKKYLRFIGDKIDLTNTFNGKYRRLRNDDVSPTVDTRFGDFRLFLHPTEHRGLTLREAARIQGFPDEFLFDHDERVAFTQVGNAVPPPVGKKVAKFARSLLCLG